MNKSDNPVCVYVLYNSNSKQIVGIYRDLEQSILHLPKKYSKMKYHDKILTDFKHKTISYSILDYTIYYNVFYGNKQHTSMKSIYVKIDEIGYKPYIFIMSEDWYNNLIYNHKSIDIHNYIGITPSLIHF
jgi:hypothetical protein